jgi:hypothetical protein
LVAQVECCGVNKFSISLYFRELAGSTTDAALENNKHPLFGTRASCFCGAMVLVADSSVCVQAFIIPVESS